MPSTVNGIGTHYYGKKNPDARVAECPFCHRTVELKSYDTRLWFVVVFIPIIPLGRKRIIDQCPACTRHYAIDLEKWETTKQLNISGVLDEFRSNPTAENAMAVHQNYLNFHQHDKAVEFRQVLKEKFADNAKVQTYLGMVLSDAGKFDEAEPCFERALQLRPDLPEARSGMAMIHVQKGRLDDARRLVDFLEKPGAAQLYSLEPLETLANAYQKDGRHAEALELFNRILEAIPTAGQHKGFRKRIQDSEKALQKTESILPKKKFSWRGLLDSTGATREAGFHLTRRGLLIGGAVVAIFVGLMAFINWHIREHRTLYVVADFKEPVKVDIRGVGTVSLRNGVQELKISEGRHHASVSGAIREEVDFDLHGQGYFSRWFDNPVWVLNVGKSAILVYERAMYRALNPLPATYEFEFGRSLHYFPSVTHPFKELPESVQVKSSEEAIRTKVDLVRLSPVSIFSFLNEKGRGDRAFELAEWRLGLHPDDQEMLRTYMGAAQSAKKSERAQKFLARGLTNRPVQVEWHRVYQDLGKRSATLAAKYDEMLAAEPTNSALLYLRGRICKNRAKAVNWFDRSRAADAKNPYPYFTSGYYRMSAGDWPAARDMLQRAVELRPDDMEFRRRLVMVKLAQGEYAALEKECRDALKKQPLDFYWNYQLLTVLAAEENKKEAEAVFSQFQRAAGQRMSEAGKITAALRVLFLYAFGDFAAIEKQALPDKTMRGRSWLFQALVEEGRAADAEKIRELGEMGKEDPFHFLVMNLAWRYAGDEQHAAPWMQRAIKELEASGDGDLEHAAALLRRTDPPSAQELDDVIIPPEGKALLMAALALNHSSQAATYSALAKKFNIERRYPYHLIDRVASRALGPQGANSSARTPAVPAQ